MDEDKLDALLEERLRREIAEDSANRPKPKPEHVAAFIAALPQGTSKARPTNAGWRAWFSVPRLRWPALGIGLAAAAALLMFTLAPVGESSGPMIKGEIRGAAEPVFLRALSNPVTVTLVPDKQEFQIPLAPGRTLTVTCTVTSVTDNLMVATATANGQLDDGRSVTGTGNVRIRTTKPARNLSGLRFTDLGWVLFELHLNAGGESGDLTLTFGAP